MPRSFDAGLTVQGLIDELMSLTDEQKQLPVAFASDYGDYTHTMQALPCCEIEGVKEIEETAYSRSGWAIVDPSDRDEDEDELWSEGATGTAEEMEEADEVVRVVVIG